MILFQIPFFFLRSDITPKNCKQNISLFSRIDDTSIIIRPIRFYSEDAFILLSRIQNQTTIAMHEIRMLFHNALLHAIYMLKNKSYVSVCNFKLEYNDNVDTRACFFQQHMCTILDQNGKITKPLRNYEQINEIDLQR